VQHAVTIEGHRRHPRDRRAHCHAPGKFHLFRAERRLAKDLGKDGGDDLVRGNHAGEDSIRPMLILASASLRRAELLTTAGIPFEVLPVHVDEAHLGAERPDDHVRRLAEEKARAALDKRGDAVVLGADTVVVIDERILGKPKDPEHAAAMLRALAGRSHEVLTGVAVLAVGRPPRIAVERTRVWMSALGNEEIAWYVATGEPMDKAGAYAIQGLASRFIERIEGSYSNVVGLPVALVYRLLDAVS
jgi:septum formation protein